jgi:hypothetical protein
VGHKRKLYELFARIKRKGVATGDKDLQDVAVELVDAWEEVIDESGMLLGNRNFEERCHISRVLGSLLCVCDGV